MKKLFLVFFVIFFVTNVFGLKITEVYFKGTNEFIGIYNETNILFSGTIYLSGAKSKNLKLDIKLDSKKEIIVGDNIDNMMTISPYKTGLSLSIKDTQDIAIDLLDSNKNKLDTFLFSSDKLPNTKTSLEKIYSGGQWITQVVSESRNNTSDYKINPAYVKYTASSTGEGETTNSIVQTLTCSILLNKNNDTYNFTYTGNSNYNNISWFINGQYISSGQSMSSFFQTGSYTINSVGYDLSGNVCTGSYGLYIFEKNVSISNNIYTGKILFNEIHPKNDSLPEYVEFKSIGNFSGDIELEGLGRGSTKYNISLNTYSGNIILIAKSYSGFLYTGNIILYDNMSLSDVGETLSILSSGHILDIVDYKKGSVLYFSSLSGSTRIFDKEGYSTPGFSNFATLYYKETVDCNIKYQNYKISDTNLSINLSADVDSKYCKSPYRQIWIYSGDIVYTGTCNPSYIDILTGNGQIQFSIFNESNEKICSDTYNTFFFQKNTPNLNCFIKIQSKEDSFLSKDSINFIAVMNGKEIQNSNTNYSCVYTLSGQVLSNKCNPNSINLSGGLLTIDLLVQSRNGPTCQSKYYLNLPSENTKVVTHSKTTPITSYDCSKLNSDKLLKLTKYVKNKYKSDTTLKKIYSPISGLYIDNIPINQKCLKQNSDKLKQLVENIKNKYKSEATLKKIFSSIKFKTNNNQKPPTIINKNVEIYSILPNPKGSDIDNEIVILSGQYLSGMSIYTNKNYLLTGGVYSGSLLYFKGTFGLKNTSSCLSLKYKNNILDYKCYMNVQEGEFINHLSTDVPDIDMSKLSISFDNDMIYLNYIGYTKTFKNDIYLNYRKKVLKVVKMVLKYMDRKNKIIKKQKKLIWKESYNSVLYKTRYLQYRQKYKKLYTDCKKDKSKKYHKIKEKNNLIRLLKNRITFLRSFIVSVKKYIDKDIYKQYLQNYRKVKQGVKIRY